MIGWCKLTYFPSLCCVLSQLFKLYQILALLIWWVNLWFQPRCADPKPKSFGNRSESGLLALHCQRNGYHELNTTKNSPPLIWEFLFLKSPYNLLLLHLLASSEEGAAKSTINFPGNNNRWWSFWVQLWLYHNLDVISWFLPHEILFLFVESAERKIDCFVILLSFKTCHKPGSLEFIYFWQQKK